MYTSDEAPQQLYFPISGGGGSAAERTAPSSSPFRLAFYVAPSLPHPAFLPLPSAAAIEPRHLHTTLSIRCSDEILEPSAPQHFSTLPTLTLLRIQRLPLFMSEYPTSGLGEREGEASPICCQLFYSFLLPTVVACPESSATYAPRSRS